MLQQIKNLFQKHKEILIYLVFGVLTTLVNYAVYLPLFNFVKLSASLSNLLAWVIAVLFAFVTNKPFVFRSFSWSPRVVVPEFLKFVGCRVASGLAETMILFVFVDTFQQNGNLWKIITGILVIALNYIGSKYIAFHNSKKKQP